MGDPGQTAGTGTPEGSGSPELRLYRLASLDGARTEWDELAASTRNVFSSWEFATAWWRHFGDDHELLLYSARTDAGRPVAILPLCRSRIRGLSIVRFVGHGVADELGPVCDDADRDVTARVLLRALRDEISWNVFIGDRLAIDHKWETFLGARTVVSETSPVLDIGGATWDQIFGGFSRNLRSKVGRSERKLMRESGLRYRLTTCHDELEADLETLFALHDARWAGESVAFTPARRAFHRDFSALALDRGWLRLWTATVDGHEAASWLGYRFGDVESFYQQGRDPAYDETSVGITLLTHSIRAAVEDRQAEYRFLRGFEPYKRRFANRDRPVATMVLANGLLSRAALGTGRALLRVPAGRRFLARVF